MYCGRQIQKEELYSDEVWGTAPFSRGPTEYTKVSDVIRTGNYDNMTV